MKTEKQVFDLNQLQKSPTDVPYEPSNQPSGDPNLTYPYDIRYFENLFQDFLSGQQYAIPPSVLITGLVGANRNQFNESDRF